MAHKEVIVALIMVIAASPLPAAQPDFSPIVPAGTATAPAGTPDTKYCLRVDPITGSNVQTIQCWTRDEWAYQGVDVDKEWPRNGVRTLA